MVILRQWWASLWRSLADTAVRAEAEDARRTLAAERANFDDEKRELETSLKKAEAAVDALQSQVELLFHTHEANISLLNKMNETHGYDSNKSRT